MISRVGLRLPPAPTSLPLLNVLGHATHSPPDLRTRRSHTHLATQCGILLPVFRALVFGLVLCFGESINLTWLDRLVISPTQKRTEGCAPVWGSEFTSKAATLQGDPAEIAATLNVKLWDSVTA